MSGKPTRRILNWLMTPKLTCQHRKGIREMRLGDFSVISSTTFGVTLGWDGRPHPLRQSTLRCKLCGATFLGIKGYVPGDTSVQRDNDGWPLTEDGSRMPIAS